MPRHSALYLWTLLALAPNIDAAEEGRLKATGGLVSIEGNAGGGLVPWAVLSGLSTAPGFDIVAGTSTTQVRDFSLASIGLTASWNNRVEVSIARQRFSLDADWVPNGLNRHIDQTILGGKLRVGGDLIYGRMPQLAVGVLYKQNHDDTLARALGAERDHDVEAYFSMTRLLLDGLFDRNWLLNGTLRATRANETGLLGFGRSGDDDYGIVGEVSAAMFFNPEFAIGAEYRQKPDGLDGLGESDWRDLFVAWFPSKHWHLAIAYVDLGTIAGQRDQDGMFLSVNGNW